MLGLVSHALVSLGDKSLDFEIPRFGSSELIHIHLRSAFEQFKGVQL